MLQSSLHFRAPRRAWQRSLSPISIAVDYPLLVTILVTAGFGMVVLYSASGESTAAMLRQSVRIAAGLSAFFVISQIPPRYMRLWAPWMFVTLLMMLVAVMLVGDIRGGSQRWLDFGFVGFQPSEFMKLAVPMMVAWFLHERTLPPTLGQLFVLMLIVAVPALLIFRQPDLGGAIQTVAAGGLTILLAGVSMRLIAGCTIAGLITAPILWKFYLLEYQRDRLRMFLDPWQDPQDAGYNIIQSQIAIGSGGTFGKGWLNGTQAHLEYLPERSTDFVFAVMGEELGFVGLVCLLLLYLILIGRGLYIAAQAQDTFTRLLAGSLSLTFFFYVFVNAGMVSGLLPVVGVPLPLVSAGGTSMVTLMAGFGILSAISRHRNLLTP